MEAQVVAGLSQPLPTLLAEGLDDIGAYAEGRAGAVLRCHHDCRRGHSDVGAKIDPFRRSFHARPPCASISTRCIAFTSDFIFVREPRMLTRHPGSLTTT